jgi:hypothetical protein
VCAELATALKYKVRIIPVLVEGAEMPTAANLPDSIARICRFHAMELLDRRWRPGLDELMEVLDELVGTLYEDTTEGFRRLILDVIDSVSRGDIAQSQALIAGLELSDPVSWFSATFGPDDGVRAAQDYAKLSGSFIAQVTNIFHEVVAKGQTLLQITALDDPKSQGVTELQAAALSAARDSLRLYSVRFLQPGKERGFHLWSFAYVDGGFRLLGKIQALGHRTADRVW